MFYVNIDYLYNKILCIHNHRRLQTFSCSNICLSTFCILKLPPRIADSEIARLAPLFTVYSLKKVAVIYFGLSEAEISNSERDHIGDTEGFNRDLLYRFINKGHSRKVILILHKRLTNVYFLHCGHIIKS